MQTSTIPDGVLIEELGLRNGYARIDVAVLGAEFHGFEIKSDCDTLNRLPAQMRTYGEVFDRVTLVVTARHFEKTRLMVPSWFGLLLAVPAGMNGEGVHFIQMRDTDSNPASTELGKSQLLWRQEALEVLETFGKAAGLANKSRRVIYERIAQEVKGDVLRRVVRERVLRRRSPPTDESRKSCDD